jgi:hypothetical protein
MKFRRKKNILEQSLFLPTNVTAGNKNCCIYAEPKNVDPKL